jgi:putative ABC transport system permease protein
VIDFLNVLRQAVIWIVSLVGIAGTANIMLMAVNERRSEIGLLVAVGWSPIRIVTVFVVEGVVICTISGLAGIGLGMVIVELARSSDTLAAFLSESMSVEIGLKGMALAVGIGTISSILPALRALSVPADTALRPV